MADAMGDRVQKEVDWLASPQGKRAMRERDRQVRELKELIGEARMMGNTGEVNDLVRSMSNLMGRNLRTFV